MRDGKLVKKSDRSFHRQRSLRCGTSQSRVYFTNLVESGVSSSKFFVTYFFRKLTVDNILLRDRVSGLLYRTRENDDFKI